VGKNTERQRTNSDRRGKADRQSLSANTSPFTYEAGRACSITALFLESLLYSHMAGVGVEMRERDVNLLLWFAALYGLGIGIVGSLVGSFVGPQILIPAICHLLVGSTAVFFLVRRRNHQAK
jgi:hypothetical protein